MYEMFGELPFLDDGFKEKHARRLQNTHCNVVVPLPTSLFPCSVYQLPLNKFAYADADRFQFSDLRMAMNRKDLQFIARHDAYDLGLYTVLKHFVLVIKG